jgi:hypothetical protein
MTRRGASEVEMLLITCDTSGIAELSLSAYPGPLKDLASGPFRLTDTTTSRIA